MKVDKSGRSTFQGKFPGVRLSLRAESVVLPAFDVERVAKTAKSIVNCGDNVMETKRWFSDAVGIRSYGEINDDAVVFRNGCHANRSMITRRKLGLPGINSKVQGVPSIPSGQRPSLGPPTCCMAVGAPTERKRIRVTDEF